MSGFDVPGGCRRAPAPVPKGVGGELGAVVHPEVLRCPTGGGHDAGELGRWFGGSLLRLRSRPGHRGGVLQRTLRDQQPPEGAYGPAKRTFCAALSPIPPWALCDVVGGERGQGQRRPQNRRAPGHGHTTDPGGRRREPRGRNGPRAGGPPPERGGPGGGEAAWFCWTLEYRGAPDRHLYG
jgi:hypothetical protein